jgi:hypothetical protein
LTPIQRLTIAGLLIGLAATSSACANRRQQQLAAQVPDDFRVVQRAPLAIPPEYALRPPQPGEPRPQELDPESAARAALVPPRPDPAQSAGERALVAKVTKGETPDPLIKALIDDEQGDLAHKTRGFADLVMFWKPGDPNTTIVRTGEETPINPAEEAARIASLTGNQPVTIQQQAVAAPKQRRLFKLPGL